ncbi:hypothetical protein ACJJIF_13305 [Microbulbifer sp. SSSA002]|uniref:hypothetical protein n=1 Tax=Microbulbifer sp. SSSA002 TaxID=3243376 RepID=UPI0040394CBA
MKIVTTILAVFFLVSCTSNMIKGEWEHEDDQSRTLIKFESAEDCFIFVGGPVDGMASECKYQSTGENSYQLWFLDEAGNTEEGYYLPFNYDHKKGIITVVAEERTIELRRKQSHF